MKRLSTLILFCFSVSAFAQEPINLECFLNGKSHSSLRLFPDRNEVVRMSPSSTIYTSWLANVVTIYVDISGPFTTENINRKTLAYEYIDHTVDGGRRTGVCKVIENKNQI
jgi:hypothetical protein